MLKDQKWTGDKLYCSVSFGNAITVNGCVVSRDERGVVLDFPKYKRADESFIPLTVFHRTLFMETLSAVFSNNQKEG